MVLGLGWVVALADLVLLYFISKIHEIDRNLYRVTSYPSLAFRKCILRSRPSWQVLHEHNLGGFGSDYFYVLLLG